jgi:hypothetical protein
LSASALRFRLRHGGGRSTPALLQPSLRLRSTFPPPNRKPKRVQKRSRYRAKQSQEIKPTAPSAVCRARESDVPLYVAGRRVKKFCGLQMEILKRLSRLEVHPHAVDSGALTSSSVWLACACQGCPKN